MPEENKNDDSAAAARKAAEDFTKNAKGMFSSLDQRMQIYLIALSVTVLCSLLFGAISIDFDLDDKVSSAMKTFSVDVERSTTSPPLVGIRSFFGVVSFLAAAAGIGILIWSVLAKRKDPWIPLALAGAAGASALSILIVRLQMRGGSGNFMTGSVDVDGTILGLWLPFFAAAAATWFAVQRIRTA